MTTIPGPIELTWRPGNGRNDNIESLFANAICVGGISRAMDDHRAFVCWLEDDTGNERGRFRTKRAAKSALETAVEEALRG